MPDVHNDTIYELLMKSCANTVGSCNLEIITRWKNIPVRPGKFGLRLSTGRGKHLNGPAALHRAFYRLANGFVNNVWDDDSGSATRTNSSFQCFAPGFTGSSRLSSKLPPDTCISLEEGLAILAQEAKLPLHIHPIYTLERGEVPGCSYNNSCRFEGINDSILGEFVSDGPGRWPQICDYYTLDFQNQITGFQLKCCQEKGCQSPETCPADKLKLPCPMAKYRLERYLLQIPCMCRWVNFAKVIASTYFPTSQGALSTLKLPHREDCQAISEDVYDCSSRPNPTGEMSSPLSTAWSKQLHPFSIPELKFLTPVWPRRDFLIEQALVPWNESWWNRHHVLTPSEKAKDTISKSKNEPATCELSQDCWLKEAMSTGSFYLAVSNCSEIPDVSCFLQRMGNLSGLEVGCISTSPEFVDDVSEINSAFYDGHYNRYRPKNPTQEFISAYELYNSNPLLLNVSIFYNDTTRVIERHSFNPTPASVRVSEPLNTIVHAFLNANTVDKPLFYASMMGIKEVSILSCFLKKN